MCVQVCRRQLHFLATRRRRRGRDVSFAIDRATVHALVGENDAGNSTLVKILTGVVHADGGEGGRARARAVFVLRPLARRDGWDLAPRGRPGPDRVPRARLHVRRFGAPEEWRERAALVRARGMEAVAHDALDKWFTPAFTDRERFS